MSKERKDELGTRWPPNVAVPEYSEKETPVPTDPFPMTVGRSHPGIVESEEPERFSGPGGFSTEEEIPPPPKPTPAKPEVQIITICDEAFARLLKVCLSSLCAYGGAGTGIPMAVYDFGLEADTTAWCESKGIEVRPIDPGDAHGFGSAGTVGAPRQLLPVTLSGMQRTFDLWICKTWAIHNAASKMQNPDDVVIFVDADMVFRSNVIEHLVESALLPEANYAAVQDAMNCRQTVNAFVDDHRADEPDFWIQTFGDAGFVDFPTWNIGLLAARARDAIAAYEKWQGFNLAWPDRANAFPIPCYDQLAFAIAMEGGAVATPPPEFNVTRLLWNDPEIAAKARGIHLTGPIKPWQPDGRLHPMTNAWRKIEAELDKAGYLG